MGIFATRSPDPPEPDCFNYAVQVVGCGLTIKMVIIQIAYIDANDGSPVLDIKPYTPSLDRVDERQCTGMVQSLAKKPGRIRRLLIGKVKCVY